MSQQTPFPFLALPPELRTKILLHTLHQPTPIPLSSPSATYPHALLLVSSQIHTEALSLYFTSNTFTLTLHRHNDDALSPFLCSPHRFLVRSLRVVIQRWGANDYFVKTFGPVLEDMILRGGLRRLLVGIREMDVRALERVGLGIERENWNVLRTLLRDPDLDDGKLMSMGRGEGGFNNCDRWWKDISWLIRE